MKKIVQKHKRFFGIVGFVSTISVFGVVTALMLAHIPKSNADTYPIIQAKATDAHRVAGSVSGASAGTVTSPTATSATTAGTKANTSVAVSPIAPAPSILKGTSLFVDPTADASRQELAWAQSHPEDAAVMQRISSTPQARWFGEWSGDVQSAVSSYVSAAANAGALPVLVAYNIPNRDCGGASAGGSGSASGYADWIRRFTAGIGARQAIVVLEPDAVASTCYSDARADMLVNAIATLKGASAASVYLDGGNPTWQSSTIMASRLNRSGIAGATGFSLNVSNFQATSSNVSYGNRISQLVGGKHFVIDTSRNGSTSPTNSWCNPSGQAFGQAPTTSTGIVNVDALVWIKTPGESDGSAASDASCNTPGLNSSAPSAGSFWIDYVLMLANNAGWK